MHVLMFFFYVKLTWLNLKWLNLKWLNLKWLSCFQIPDKYCIWQWDNLKRCYNLREGPLWLWSYGSWIYNYICIQSLSQLKLWVWTPFMAKCTRYNIVIELVNDLRQVGGFLLVFRFPPLVKNWPPQYNWKWH